jgi:hypothetical protein
MNSNFVRFAIAAVAVLLAAIIGFIYFSGSGVGDYTAPSPPPSAAVSPSALPFTTNDVPAGTYSLRQFPVGITFEIPAGFVSCSAGPVEQAVCWDTTDTEFGFAVGFLIVDNVVADPCGSGASLRDPPAGPSVEALVTAISNLDGFEATEAKDITVDGFSGSEFTVTAPVDAGCDLKTWVTRTRANGVGPGEINLLRILDVGFVRVMISGAYPPETPAEQVSIMEQVMDSVRIER